MHAQLICREERKTPEWRLPDGVSLVLSHQDSIVSFTAQRAAIGQWSCGLTGRPEARRGTFNVSSWTVVPSVC